MPLRPLARTLIVPVLGLSLKGTNHSILDGVPVSKVVNINEASEAELSRLPGFATGKAREIISWRTTFGPFKRIEDIMAVGTTSRTTVGEKLFARIKPYIAVSGPTTLTTKVGS